MKKIFVLILLSLNSFVDYSQSTDTIKVMSYNLLKFPQQNPARISTLENILQESLPDLLMVCELTSSSGANAILTNALNTNGINYYDKSTYIPGTDTENMIYYNTNKLTLYEENIISTDLRDINEYVLYYNSSDIATTLDTTFFYVFVCHLKAGITETVLRNNMAVDMKEYMALRGEMENVLVGGDFNVYGSSEDVWSTVLSGSGVELVDPINTPGEWHNDWFYADVHTQSTRTLSVDGGATGGMDDRFDLIFMSPDLQSWGSQAKYIDGSYWAYGQDGVHFNLALTDSPANTSLPANIIQDLYEMSDHLPVYMEIEVQQSFNEIVEEEEGIQIIYNSSSEELVFKFNKSVQDVVVFQLFSISGALVRNNVFLGDDQKMDVSFLESGIYFIRSEEINFSFKFKK